MHSPSFWKRSQLKTYVSRINTVLDYIDTHLEKPFTLDELAEVACFSKFHFHRIFFSLIGETLFQYIQRLRLEKAASLLLSDEDTSITQIAMDVGFSGSAPFARAFREHFTCTPSAWRNQHRNLGIDHSNSGQHPRNIAKDSSRLSLYNSAITLHTRRLMDMESRQQDLAQPFEEVRVRRFDEMTVAYVRYIGPYQGDEGLFERLSQQLHRWAGPRNLIQYPHTQFLIAYHDNPEITEVEKLRVSVCITVPADTKVDGEIGKMTIPEGDYAIGRFEVMGDEFQKAWNYMCGAWLPQSGYVPDDRLCFEMYPKSKEAHPEGKFTVDICIPIKPME